jgi:hypothetical protein
LENAETPFMIRLSKKATLKKYPPFNLVKTNMHFGKAVIIENSEEHYIKFESNCETKKLKEEVMHLSELLFFLFFLYHLDKLF